MRPQLPPDDASDYQRDQRRLLRLEQATDVPTGAVVLWPSAVAVPDGWITCAGGTFDGALYPQLAALWGTTTLPPNPGLTGYAAIVRAR